MSRLPNHKKTKFNLPFTGKFFPQFIFIIGIFFCNYSLGALPTYQEVKSQYHPSDIQVFDRSGELIQRYRIRKDYRSEEWTDYEKLPKFLIDSVIHAEDKRFFEHTGIDSNALVSSFLVNLKGQTLRGGSTITMQLVSLLDPELKSSASKRKTIFQKLKQIQRAVELEKTWSKEEIFAAYINLIYFRGELKGITSASKGLFRKSPDALTPNEAYLLAALIRSPQSSIEKVIKRVCLLKKEKDGASDCESLSQFVRESLFRNLDYPQYPSFVPLYTKTILDVSFAEKNKEQVHYNSQVNSSLSLTFQRKVEEILKRNVKTLTDKNVKDGAVIVIENRTGQVLVYVPNIGEESSVSKLDLIRSKRQVGSTLKPFVYAQNFEENKLNPDSILSDSPVGIPVYQGIYRPLNYDKSYKGNVTVRESLGSSLNIPAIRALSFLDINEFILVLERLGITGLRYPEFYGPSLALGTADITLLELTNAYRTLANGGMYSELIFDLSSELINPRRVFSPKTSYLVSEILSDREARSLGFGWDNFLSTAYYTSVKTGTSQDMRDNWCIGYSEIYTVGVWVGNPTGAPMLDVSGITGAAPVWRETMDLLHESLGSKLNPPQEISSDDSNSSFTSSKESRIERTKTTRILTPVNGSIFALDPDIPLGRQKILFTFSSYDVSYSYYLNDEKIGSAGGPYLWEPKKGEYRLQVKDRDDKVLSLSLFEVR
ncbi:penicillin-binding protein 1C [Leptospira bandrabouensis]|uniref:penicillin-binding protein 1C n=1 Tax=Leptospira bandrabouensis TaxID=2484903 RepID=UPI001EE8BC4E|nr:penicillin-binding protein 1C [Leptospira bandrabouensis]MCG6143480.1 penicillin-binding protein 1C [Leptospira bandrabouensis]MCG6159140.1 penicillin-binding protein 1C [Leptospira bandrabouensis]MCG6163074.1 penicillin-binding protein 1C [Leptospira bandrabouensis]